MNIKILMTISALFLGVLGISFSFFTDEIIIPLTILYALFAIAFAYVFLTNPNKVAREKK